MSRNSPKTQIACEFFRWRLFCRDGVYYADGRKTSQNLGKHSLGTRNREEALLNLRELDHRKAIELGMTQPQPVIGTRALSIRDGWEAFLRHCGRPDVMGGVSHRSLKRYRAVLDKHIRFCDRNGIASWQTVDKNATTAYGQWLTANDYFDRTIYFELTLIKSVIRWLIDEGTLPASARFRLPLRKPQGTDTYCYRREEVQAMVNFCRKRPELGWLGDVIVALACTGLRISELASLRRSDLDWQAGVLTLTDERSSGRRKRMGTVRTTKGRRGRSLPIHPALRKVLEHLPQRADGRLLQGPRGGVLKPDTVRNILVREVLSALKECFPTPKGEIGFEHGRVHSFRHFFVSQAFLGGASQGEIMSWVGHRDSKMVAHYRHLRPEESQRRMDVIDFLGTIEVSAVSANPG